MARSPNIGIHFSEKRIRRVLNIAPQIHSKVGCVNGGRRLGSLKDTKALATAASREAGVHIESAPTAGISGMFTAGSDPRGPDPGVGMVKSVKADRWVGFHVGDKAPALGTSRSDGVLMLLKTLKNSKMMRLKRKKLSQGEILLYPGTPEEIL